MTRITIQTITALLLTAAIAGAGSIGPDRFGYVANDTTPYGFIDISGTGTAVLAGADDDQAVLNLPFAFSFYGRPYTSVCASSNGLLSFGGCNPDFSNQDLTASVPRGDLASIAPFWTDLTFAVPGSGAVFYEAIGEPGSRRFIVQWQNARPLDAPLPVTFQAVLEEATGRILFQYRDVDAGAGIRATNGGGASVGIRDAGGQINGNCLQWSFNAPALTSNYAIEFLPLGVTPVDLGWAGPSHWALLSLGGSPRIDMTGSAAVGGAVPDVGIGPGGRVAMSGSTRIDGRLWAASGTQIAPSGSAVIGGVVRGNAADAALSSAAADATAASQTAAALKTTVPGINSINIGGHDGNRVITGIPGINVLNLADLVISRGSLTLQAGPDARFVINVAGRFEVTGSSAITLQGGIMPFNVLFNVVGAGNDVEISGSSGHGVPRTQVAGVILAPGRRVQLQPGTVLGEVITGGAVVLTGKARLENPF